MDLEAALRQLAESLSQGDARGSRNAALHAARQVVTDQCRLALGVETGGASINSVIRLATEAEHPATRRSCALLVVHALGVPGLIPAAAGADICALAESGLRTVLLRCGYPFGGSVADKISVLERLHRTIGELMQPYEPTFPNWQGLYAG